MNRRQGGFTLLELVVVIALVAVLAGQMEPAFSSARDRARQVHCISNQRQLAAAFMNYAADWDGVLPRWYTQDGGPRTSTLGLPAGQRDWAVDTLPYVQNERLYICPSKNLVRGYGINLWLSQPDGFPLDDIEYKARTAMFAEIAGGRPARDIYDFVPGSTPEGWPVDPRFQFDPRHEGGANIAFADGHARWVPSSIYTRWPADAGDYLLTRNSAANRGTPVGTYWWPTAAFPPGE